MLSPARLLLLLTASALLPWAASSAVWDHADGADDGAVALDLADFYVLARGDRVAFVLTVAPGLEPGAATEAARLHPGALYQVHLDRDRDGSAEAVIQIAALGSGTGQRVDVRGPAAPDSTGPVTHIVDAPSVSAAFGVPAQGVDVSVFAGARDDPFFGNLYGNESLTSVLNDAYGAGLGQQVGAGGEQSNAFTTPPEDDLRETNVLALVVEVPRDRIAQALGIPASGAFHAWATSSRRP